MSARLSVKGVSCTQPCESLRADEEQGQSIVGALALITTLDRL